LCCCFFFQAEDGIRDRNVTGVQTCALPISASRKLIPTYRNVRGRDWSASNNAPFGSAAGNQRSSGGGILRGVKRGGCKRCRKEEIGRASCRERVEISVVAGGVKKKREGGRR